MDKIILKKMVDTEEILKKYGSKIEAQMNASGTSQSKSYIKFKGEMVSVLSPYEKWCKSLGSVIKLNVSKKDEERVRKHLDVAHLDVEPWQALTLSVMAFLAVFFIGILSSVAVALLNSTPTTGSPSTCLT